MLWLGVWAARAPGGGPWLPVAAAAASARCPQPVVRAGQPSSARRWRRRDRAATRWRPPGRGLQRHCGDARLLRHPFRRLWRSDSRAGARGGPDAADFFLGILTNARTCSGVALWLAGACAALLSSHGPVRHLGRRRGVALGLTGAVCSRGLCCECGYGLDWHSDNTRVFSHFAFPSLRLFSRSGFPGGGVFQRRVFAQSSGSSSRRVRWPRLPSLVSKDKAVVDKGAVSIWFRIVNELLPKSTMPPDGGPRSRTSKSRLRTGP